jgi:hypothetical protein
VRASLAILILCVACTPKQPEDSEVLPIDAAKADRFVSYQQQLIPLLREWTKASHESKAKGEVGKYGGGFSERYERIREQNGLSEKELPALGEIAALVATRDAGLKERLAQQSSLTEKQMATLPAERREAANKSVEDLRRLGANMLELQELRKKHGDAIVDAMLQRQDELKRQRTELASIE